MKIIKPYIKEIVFYLPDNNKTIEEEMESAARTCYRSEGKIKEGSADKLIKKLKNRKHEAMLEFGSVSMKLCTDIGCTREGNRHRLLSIAESSTRYCNFSKDKFNNEITFIEQEFKNPKSMLVWLDCLAVTEKTYMQLIELGEKPEIARSVLPLCTRTDVVYMGNLREWRHIFRLRCSKAAHPIIRNIMLEALEKFNTKCPVLFEDLAEEFL